MSVLKSNRGQSKMQFLETARELTEFTKTQCVKLPKRYTFFGVQRTWECADNIFANIKRGNSIYPTNPHEAQMRRDYFLIALADLHVLAAYIDDIKRRFPIKDTVIGLWVEMVTTEQKLLKSILEKDKERYSKLWSEQNNI